jgi:peptide chain release factor 3
MKAKKLKQALQELAEEGVVQVFRPADGSPSLVGVVGQLQLDVLRIRLSDEYGLEISWDTPEFGLARWINSNDSKVLDRFVASNSHSIADDVDGDPVFLARNNFNLDYTGKQNSGITFTDVKDVHAHAKRA